jgi:hypothetical protein
MAFYDAKRVPEDIPDSAVKIPSILYALRLMSTERTTDPKPGETKLNPTALVQRAKARGQTDAALLETASITIPQFGASASEAKAQMLNLPEYKNYTPSPSRTPYRVSAPKTDAFQGSSLLDILRLDLFARQQFPVWPQLRLDQRATA